MFMDQEIKKEFEDLTEIIKSGVDEVDKRAGRMEADLEHVKNQMVTKDYLDEKLAENYGNLVVLMRKEDVKLLRLVELLKKKAVISDDEVKELLALEPFPKLAL